MTRERGEPRGVGSKESTRAEQNLGDCVACKLCVQVCPTGIDIRDGLQYECIGCAACIDACDHVMEKAGMPKGLIRYSTERALKDHYAGKGIWGHVLRPRLLVYSGILVAISSALVVAVALRVPLKVDVIRDRGALAREAEDGRIENTYRLQVMNTAERAQSYAVSASGMPGLELASEPTFDVPGASTRSVPVRLRARADDVPPGSNKVAHRGQVARPSGRRRRGKDGISRAAAVTQPRATDGPANVDATRPWYRQRWPWFLIALPATAVVGGIITAVLAVRTFDGTVSADYYKQGLAINEEVERAQLARVLGLEARIVMSGVGEGDRVRIEVHSTRALPADTKVLLQLIHPGRPGRGPDRNAASGSTSIPIRAVRHTPARSGWRRVRHASAGRRPGRWSWSRRTGAWMIHSPGRVANLPSRRARVRAVRNKGEMTMSDSLAQRLGWVLWPSFLVACVAELLLFSLFDPRDLYLFGRPVEVAGWWGYTLGFFALWAIGAVSSALTVFLERSPFEVNRRMLTVAESTDARPKREDLAEPATLPLERS